MHLSFQPFGVDGRRVDTYFSRFGEHGEKTLGFNKYPGTCGRELQIVSNCKLSEKFRAYNALELCTIIEVLLFLLNKKCITKNFLVSNLPRYHGLTLSNFLGQSEKRSVAVLWAWNFSLTLRL